MNGKEYEFEKVLGQVHHVQDDRYCPCGWYRRIFKRNYYELVLADSALSPLVISIISLRLPETELEDQGSEKNYILCLIE
jgi:hypothetical protein